MPHSPHSYYHQTPEINNPYASVINRILSASDDGSSDSKFFAGYYPRPYLEEVFKYFKDFGRLLIMNPHFNKFMRYFEALTATNIQYIKDCPKRPDCEAIANTKVEFTILADVLKFLNQEITKFKAPNNHLANITAIAITRLEAIKEQIKGLPLDLHAQIAAGQFPGLSQEKLRTIYKEFIEELENKSLNELAHCTEEAILFECLKPQITTSPVFTNATEETSTASALVNQTATILLNPTTATEVHRRNTTTSKEIVTLSETTASTSTSQHTTLSHTNKSAASLFFSTPASTTPSTSLNITHTSLENSSTYDELNKTLTNPPTPLAPSHSTSLLPYQLASSAVMGAAMPVINEGFDLFSDICLRNCSPKIRKNVARMITTLKFCGISTAYLLYPLMSTLIDETDSKAIEWKIVVFLSTTLVSVASHYLANRYNKVLYAKVLLPFYMAFNFLTAGDTTTALWCYFANTISSSISLFVISCVKGNEKNIENTENTLKLEEELKEISISPEEHTPFLGTQKLVEIDENSEKKASLLHESSFSSSSTNRTGSDSTASTHCSSDSNESHQTELLPLTAKNCQLYLKQIEPQLGSLQTDILSLQKVIKEIIPLKLDLTRIPLSKKGKELLSIPLDKQKLQTRDGHNVETGLTYVYDSVKPLANCIQSISNENVYNLNTSMLERVTREFIYMRSILAEIKNLAAEMKNLTENAVSSIAKQTKKIPSQIKLIEDIDEKLEVFLKKIPKIVTSTSATNEPTINNNYSNSLVTVHFLKEDELSELRQNFNTIKNNLDTLEKLLKVKLGFQSSLENINTYLFQRFYDFSCLNYPNYKSMIKDKNVNVSVGFFNTIIQHLDSIKDKASLQTIMLNNETFELNKEVVEITEEVKHIIDKMRDTIDSMQHRFEYKQSYTKGKQDGLAKAAKEKLSQASKIQKRTTADSYFFAVNQEDEQTNRQNNTTAALSFN